MEKIIPYDKLNKKEKRKIDNRKRNMWNINPVTRREEKNKYKEKKYDIPIEE